MKLLLILTLAALAVALEGKVLTIDSSKLLNAVVKKSPNKSLVFSGYSAFCPVAQLGLGAVGDSHEQILQALDLSNDALVKDVFTNIKQHLLSVKKIELKFANIVYIPKDLELNETFAEMSREVFQSDVKNIDFSKNIEAAAKINSWVDSKTNGIIKEMVAPGDLSSSTQALILNTIYFKGAWERAFDKGFTKQRDFHVTEDKTIKLPTMFQQGYFKYAHSDDLKAKLLEMNYADREASMLIIVPDDVGGLAALEDKLADSSMMEQAMEKMKETLVNVYIPRVKVHTKTDVKAAFEKIGVTKLFTGEAKLNYVIKSDKDLFVSEAIQKTYIDITEEGTDGAAATKVVIVNSAAPSTNEPEEFVANRPFFFTLRSGYVSLFAGVFHE